MKISDHRHVLKLAIPNIITNISIPLLGSVDLALMGHHAGLEAMDAVALGSVIFNLLYWGLGFFRMGTTGLAAQAAGANDQKALRRILVQGVFFAFVVGLFLLLTRSSVAQLAMWILSAETIIEDTAQIYISIRLVAAPAVLMAAVLTGWLLGRQHVRWVLAITVFVNLANIILNMGFVLGLDWGVSGLAWATAIAQYVGCAVGIFLIKALYPEMLKGCLFDQWLDIKQLKFFLNVNRDIFLRTLGMIAVFLFFNDRSAAQGAVILGANAVLQQFTHWVAYALDGFAYAAETLVGHYTGRQDREKIKKTAQVIFVWGVISSVMITVVLILFRRPLLEIFTHDEQVLQLAEQFWPWVLLFPLCGVACYLWDGIYIGLTAVRQMRQTMFVSMVLFFLTYALTEIVHFGNHGLWLALLVFVLTRSVTQTIVAHKLFL